MFIVGQVGDLSSHEKRSVGENAPRVEPGPLGELL